MLDRARSHGPLSAKAARSLLIVALASISLLAAVEPGTSSARKPAPQHADFVNGHALDGQPRDKEGDRLGDHKTDNTILAHADDKILAVPVSKATDSKVAVSKFAVSKDPTYSFAGTVVDQRGKPVAGAKISLSYFRKQALAADPTAAVADVQGRFNFSCETSDLADLYNERYLPDIRVVAVKEGYGFASVPATACEKTGQLAAAIHELKSPAPSPAGGGGSNVLTLVPDDIPIRGRLLTIDGRAVAGAKIAVVAAWAGENGSLDAFEEKLKESPGWRGLLTLYRGYVQAGATSYLNGKRWYLDAAVWNERRSSIIAPVQSDADGRFTIAGLGRERLAEILITASGLETSVRPVRTRRGPVLRMGGPDHEISEVIESSDCLLVLAPSVPIEGRIVDAKTRQPLAGVRVQPTSTVFAQAFADAQGRYRLEGLPLGSHHLEILPPKGTRYLPGGVRVETKAGSQHVVRDIALAAGVLVHGQAIDEGTRQPIRGRVHYFAFEPNPLLENTDSLRFNLTWNIVRTDSEGRFETAALPGAGILGFEAAAEFPHGIGADRIQGPRRAASGSFEEFRTVPQYCSPTNLNLVVPLNLKAEDREIAQDLRLHSGADVPVHLVAFDGRPLAGECFVHGDRLRLVAWRRNEGDRFTVVGYVPTETRRLEVYHPGGNLVGRYDLSGKPPATVTITLRPGASIAGRVLDEDGQPVPHAPIRCNGGRPGMTDGQGRFEIVGIVPGSKYTARVLVRGERNKPRFGMFNLFTDVTAKEGETTQLGDLRLKPREPKALEKEKKSDASTKPKTAIAEASQRPLRDSKAAEPATDQARLRLSGTVLLPNGDPAVGATVLLEGILSRLKGGENKWTLAAELSADARGAFDREIDGRWRPGDFANIRLTAIMPGYGRSVTVHPWAKELRSIVLRLAGEGPIRARILNLEGRPIAGVRVEAVQIHPNKNEGVDREPLGLPSGVTDAAGQVEIRGLGRERLVLLKIVGPGIAAAKVYVSNHSTKSNESNPASRPFIPFEYIAGPGTVITGTVRDAATNKPIAGAIVASEALDGENTEAGGYLSATTDAQGRYRLDGLSRKRRITVTVTRPNSNYLPTDIELGRSDTLEPVHEEITLKRGVWAVGRAFNIKTGQPVAATLFYTPFQSNEFAQKTRRSGSMQFVDDTPAGHTDGEGRFRIPVLPGRGVIALRCATGDYVPAFGAAKSRVLSDQQTELATVDSLIPAWFDSVAEMNLKPNVGELRIGLPVDPGQDVVFKFVDRAGRPLSGAQVHGMMPRRDGFTKTDSITIPATSPDQTRKIWIKQTEVNSPVLRKDGLCKILHFKPIPGERERTITLEPPAVLTGRLLSPEGEPLRDVPLDCDYDLSHARTDAQGRFLIEVPAGGPYEVASRSGSLLSLARGLTVKSGERVDLGELVVDTKRNGSTVTPKMPPMRTLPPAADAAQNANSKTGETPK